MSALESTIAKLLTEAQRPGLLGLIGKTIEKRCRLDLQAHFADLGKKIKALKLESLAASNTMTPELARHAVEMQLHNVLRIARPNLEAALQTNIAEAIVKAGKIQVAAEAADTNNSIDKVGMTAQQAADYAAQQAAQLVTGIDQTTQQSIADAIAAGIEQQLGVAGTADLIQNVVAGLSTWRAAMIATTEMNDAMNTAFLSKLQANDVAYKQWIVGPNPCPECEDNADASPIPVDEDFPSGDDSPPAHPNCACAVAGARAPADF